MRRTITLLAAAGIALAATPAGANLAVAPLAPEHVAIETSGRVDGTRADDAVARSFDGARTWVPGVAVPESWGGIGAGPWMTGRGGTILAAATQGQALYRSTDGGLTWAPSGSMRAITQDKTILPDPVRAGVAWFCAGKFDGGGSDMSPLMRTDDDGVSWQKRSSLGRECDNLAVQRAAVGTPVLLANTESPGSHRTHRGYLRRSTDDGRTWRTVRLPFPPTGAPAFDPDRPNVVIAQAFHWPGARNDRLIWRSTDAGLTWRLAAGRIATLRCGPRGNERCIAYDVYGEIASGSGRFLLGPLFPAGKRNPAKARYYASTDHGKSWKLIPGPPGLGFSSRDLPFTTVSGGTPNTVFAGVWRFDRDAPWSRLALPTPP